MYTSQVYIPTHSFSPGYWLGRLSTHALNFLNSSPCNGFVSMSAHIESVGKCWISICLNDMVFVWCIYACAVWMNVCHVCDVFMSVMYVWMHGMSCVWCIHVCDVCMNAWHVMCVMYSCLCCMYECMVCHVCDICIYAWYVDIYVLFMVYHLSILRTVYCHVRNCCSSAYCWNIYLANVHIIQLSHPGEKTGKLTTKV
jgi:hypothetical protein